MASEKEIKEIEEKILRRSIRPDFIRDLMDWGREKYARVRGKSELLNRVHSRNMYRDFLHHVDRNNWHMMSDGVYHIIEYLSHGEQAPMPVHIRLLLDSDKESAKHYVKGIKFSNE